MRQYNRLFVFFWCLFLRWLRPSHCDEITKGLDGDGTRVTHRNPLPGVTRVTRVNDVVVAKASQWTTCRRSM